MLLYMFISVKNFLVLLIIKLPFQISSVIKMSNRVVNHRMRPKRIYQKIWMIYWS